MDDKSKVIFKVFSFSNTSDEVASIIAKLAPYSPNDIEIGMETTGHYWLSVYSFLI